MILLLPGIAVANPNGATVRHGSVDIARSGNLLQVHQHTQNAVIDWQSFSIQSGETTQFLQPGSSAAILNRVTGVSQSQIDGLLKANGRVLLVNPNGIVIGRGGRIDVGGFVASSLDVSNAEFLAGGDMTFRGGPNSGAVVNLGSVRAGDGDVFLFAPRVENAGSLSAPNGTIGLGAGSTVLLKATGSERIFIEGEGTVVNSGSVAANLAELKAHGGNVYAMAIKNSGRVVATGVRRQGGQVFLTGRGGKVKNSGTISATRSNGSGGAVKVEAKDVELESATVITVEGSTGVGGVIDLFAESLVINDDVLVDASGATGGGTIFAG
ncbi:MAG: filamentous hemagglutinin N-terminal domain-containing protein, partial [Verrucomicrobiota bacterium]